MKVSIIRLDSTPEGTFGTMLLNGRAFCCTLEEWWRENGFDSCIPAGIYQAFRRTSPSKGIEVWQLKDVPGRTEIQIHPGNTVLDTLGCTLVGSSYGKLRDNRAVLNSGATFELFMQITRRETLLTVEYVSAIPGMAFAA